MALYQVVVGNIGTVCDTDNLKEAQRDYNLYVTASKGGTDGSSVVGSAAGEPVTFWARGEPTREHDPYVFRVKLCELRVRVSRARLVFTRAKLAEQRHLGRCSEVALAGLTAEVRNAERLLKYDDEQLKVAVEEASRGE